MLGNQLDYSAFEGSGSLRELIDPERLPGLQIEIVIPLELELFRRILC